MSDFNVLKDYYIRYLKLVRGNSDSSVNHYLGALQTISKYLVQKGKLVSTIYEIDVAPLSAWLDIHIVACHKINRYTVTKE